MAGTPAADDRRQVEVERTGPLRFRATNSRGTTLDLGTGEDSAFTPVELLLVALAGCSAIDVDAITGKRAQPEDFRVTAGGDKVRDGDGNHLTGLTLDFAVRFPDDDAGAAAEAVLRRAVELSHDRLCTVSRTVELGTPVGVRLRGDALAGGAAGAA